VNGVKEEVLFLPPFLSCLLSRDSLGFSDKNDTVGLIMELGSVGEKV
jgi:hypothetical protein